MEPVAGRRLPMDRNELRQHRPLGGIDLAPCGLRLEAASAPWPGITSQWSVAHGLWRALSGGPAWTSERLGLRHRAQFHRIAHARGGHRAPRGPVRVADDERRL